MHTENAGLVDRICNDQMARWREGERVPAEAYLESHPELKGDDDSFFELIYGEYVIRESLGESVDLEVFAGRFPRFAHRLRQQVALHQAFRDDDISTAPHRDPSFSDDPGPPHEIPGYDLLGELGRGAVGIVYRARQHGLNRLVALKVIRAWVYNDPEVAARFRAEAETAARFQHPNIIQVYDVGEHHGQGYLALEYADGGSLRDRLGGMPQRPMEAARLVETLALAAHYAHQRGIIHRDLKPANVVLTQDGVPKVTDFGLAKLVATEDGLTCTGDVLGTPNYMAPEQARGAVDSITPATDVYALGAILYEAITGRPPFQGATPLSVLEQVNSQEPLPPGRLQWHTPRELETVCLKCLEKDHRKRYGTAAELASDLRRFQEGRPILARRVGLAGRIWRWGRREPVKAGLLVALLAAMATGLGVAANLWGKAETKAIEAEAAESVARDHLYDSQISQSRLEWRLNDVGRADRILDQCDPTRRSWEWHHLRDVNRPEILATEFLDTTCVSDIAFNPDGTRMAVGRFFPYQGRAEETEHPAPLEVWDVAAGRMIRSLPGLPHTCRVEFSPDGREVAVSGAYGDVHIWDSTDGRKLKEFKGSGALAFSPDGKYLISGETKEVLIRDADSGGVVRRLPSGGGRATFAPDGRTVAVSGIDAVQILDAQSGKELRRLPHGPGEGAARHERFFNIEGPVLEFSPDGHALVVATNPPRIWNPELGQALCELVGHDGFVNGVAFSPDGRRVATAGADTTVRVWDAHNGSEKRIFRGHPEFVGCVAFLPWSWALASGGRKTGELKVWDLTRNPEYRSVRSASSHAILFDDDSRLHSVNASGQIRTYEPKTGITHLGASVEITRAWLTPAVYADFSDDGQRLATISRDALVVKVWDPSTGRELAALRGLTHRATVVDCGRDGQRVAALGINPIKVDPRREVRVWDTGSGATLASFSTSRWPYRFLHGAVALSPDGSLVAYDDYTGDTEETVNTSLHIRDVTRGHERILLPFDHSPVFAIVFSPDGRLIAAADANGSVSIWEVANGRVVGNVQAQNLAIYRLAFSPDSRRLAGVHRDKAIVWDVHGGRELLVLRIDSRRSIDGGYNPTLAWSDDGLLLANSNWDGSLSVWDGPDKPLSTSARLEEASHRAFEWHCGEAEAALGENHASEAAFHLRKLCRAVPPDQQSRMRRARLAMRFADWEFASADFASCLSTDDPHESFVWLGAARVLLTLGDVAEYRRLRERFLQHATTHPDSIDPAHAVWFLGLAADSDPAVILRFANQANKDRPGDPFCELSLGLAHYRAGRWEMAIELATRAIQNEKVLAPRGHLLLALASARLGRQEDARRWLGAFQNSSDELPVVRSPEEPRMLVADDRPEILLLRKEAQQWAGLP